MAIPVIMVALVLVMTPLIVGLLCTAHFMEAAKVIHRNHHNHLTEAAEILHPIELADQIVDVGHGGGDQPLEVAEIVQWHRGNHLMNITEMIIQHHMLAYWF
ncbi:uncharacterized protein LOC129310512 [Prosopis cineraria]|uniref:uncharacterized protein LOC129310512 n=1 Tax=Prosopis cineraria TaxID=364024 RepID=UPI00241052B4|nr:uncharacterized protein LOC129310512 [Prosopis cineraria]